jgi:hypothetical protein
MHISSRFATLATAFSVGAGMVTATGTAYAADTVTSLSATDMAAALQDVATSSAEASRTGWRATTSIAAGSFSGTGSFAVDPAAGVALDRLQVAGMTVVTYAVGGKGTYERLADPESRAAVRMMKRAAVRYSFTADPKLSLSRYVADNGFAPTAILSDDVAHAGTKTQHDDGSADYRFKPDGSTTVTLAVSPAGILSKVAARDTGTTITVTYGYGAQRIAVPTSAVSIRSTVLATALAYLHMGDIVKDVAHDGATRTRRAAHGRTVKVSSLRTAARRAAADTNATFRMTMVKVKNIRGGAKVYATNPWTNQTVAYTVKASRKKVLVRKA